MGKTGTGNIPQRQLLSPVKNKMEVECSNSRPPGPDSLTGEEEAATEKFLENVNKWRAARELKQLSRSSALKFLMARKFNVDRALVLYQQHEIMRFTIRFTSMGSSSTLKHRS